MNERPAPFELDKLIPFMDLLDIQYEKQQGIARLTFNRPEQMNAFREQTRKELLTVLAAFESDHDARVLLITGRGRAFCAGADLAEMNELLADAFDEARFRAILEEFQDITRRLKHIEKPIVAVLNGLAIGVGVEIALACDLRLAATDAYFAFTEVKQSLFQTNGVLYTLPRMVGWGRALEWMMTGRKIKGEEAMQAGLISELCAPQDLDTKAWELAEVLSQNAPITLRLLKQVAWRSMEASLEEVMEMEVEGMITCLKSQDLKEGTQAFLEKRPANYRGL
ncbi:MAG: enoyl-CoA hydratase/isomerase family protein [Bacteroidota bacterium]